MRKLLKSHARGRHTGISIVSDQVAAADFNRIHANLRGGQIDQTFGHRTGDRMSDRPVLAHDILVLEDDPGPCPIVLGDIWSADQIDHLVCLDGAGSRIHRIGPDPRQIVDLESGNRAVQPDADSPLTAMITSVNVGVEALNPVGDEFDRPAQELGQCVSRHFVGIDMDLDAEGAADILADHTNLRFLQPQVQGCDVLHHVRCLRALVDRKSRLSRIPVGNNRSRLKGHASMAPEDEFGFDYLLRLGKCSIDIACIVGPLKGKIVPKRGVNDRGGEVECGAHVHNRVEFFVVDGEMLQGIFGRRTAVRHNRRNRLTLPADPVNCDGALRRRLQSLQV